VDPLVKFKIVGKDWVASEYYDRAEETDWLEPLWAEESPFLRFFRKLDLTCILLWTWPPRREAPRFSASCYPEDINIENIEFCRKRFSDAPRFRCLLTNGHSSSTGAGLGGELFGTRLPDIGRASYRTPLTHRPKLFSERITGASISSAKWHRVKNGATAI
jgi:hypothetical protein